MTFANDGQKLTSLISLRFAGDFAPFGKPPEPLPPQLPLPIHRG